MYKITNYREMPDFMVDIEFCVYGSKPMNYTINSKTKLGMLTSLGEHTFQYWQVCINDFWFIMNQYHKVWIAERKTQTMIRFWQFNELKDKMRDKSAMQKVDLVLKNIELFQYFCELLSESQFTFQGLKSDIEKLCKILIELDKKQNSEYMKSMQTLLNLAS